MMSSFQKSFLQLPDSTRPGNWQDGNNLSRTTNVYLFLQSLAPLVVVLSVFRLYDLLKGLDLQFDPVGAAILQHLMVWNDLSIGHLLNQELDL